MTLDPRFLGAGLGAAFSQEASGLDSGERAGLRRAGWTRKRRAGWKNPGFHLTGGKRQAIFDCVQETTRQRKGNKMKTSEQKIHNLSTYILNHGLKLGQDFFWHEKTQKFEISVAYDPKTGVVEFAMVDPTLTAVRNALGY
jgi:hypothetical protein